MARKLQLLNGWKMLWKFGGKKLENLKVKRGGGGWVGNSAKSVLLENFLIFSLGWRNVVFVQDPSQCCTTRHLFIPDTRGSRVTLVFPSVSLLKELSNSRSVPILWFLVFPQGRQGSAQGTGRGRIIETNFAWNFLLFLEVIFLQAQTCLLLLICSPGLRVRVIFLFSGRESCSHALRRNMLCVIDVS